MKKRKKGHRREKVKMLKGISNIGVDFISKKPKVKNRFMMMPNYQYEINVRIENEKIRLEYIFNNTQIEGQEYVLVFAVPIENNISLEELNRRLEVATKRQQFVIVINHNQFPEKDNISFIGMNINKPIEFSGFYAKWPMSYTRGRLSGIPIFEYDNFNDIQTLMLHVKKTKFSIKTNK